MFKSKLRPIVITQAEHGKLAGTLAFLWGNAHFDRPPVDFFSFVAGVTLHDRGYGLLDNAPLLATPDEEWLQITRAGFYQPCANPVVDLITKLHLRRLLGYNLATAPRQALFTEMETVIQAQWSAHKLKQADFERMDRITRFCDDLAFSFCFETPTQGTVKVFPKNDQDNEVDLQYTIVPSIASSEILVNPWPFAVESYTGYLMGYQQEDYPARLEPVLVPFHIGKAR